MKVIHVIPSLHIYGGAEKIVDKLAEANDDCVFEIYRNIDKLNALTKIKYILISIFRLIKIRHEASIFHVHLFPSLYLSLFLPKSKVVIHEHNTHNRRREVRFLSILEAFIYKRAAAVICISEATKLSLESWCGRIDRVRVVSNFTRFEYQENEIVKMGPSVRLLMVASLTNQKRHESLIEIFSFLPKNYHLDLLGDGSNRKKINDLIIKHGLVDRVVMHGNVDNVAGFYNNSDACVLLSNWEGFGLVVVEAASFNKVTICSNVSGLSDVVSCDELLIDNQLSSIQLAKKIDKLVIKIRNKPELYSEYCKGLTDRYSFDNYCNELREIYTNVLLYQKRGSV